MKRKIESELLVWKEKTNKMPLIISGARQVGKTYSVLSFGNANYRNVAYFNFESNHEVQKIFNIDLNPRRILRELSVIAGNQILPADTLIFFDEIQACEPALTSLKYFQEETPEYQIIAAGSLLGVAVNRKQYSFPVGKVELMTMFPMDFEEFLWANNQHTDTGLIQEHFENNQQFSLHSTMLELYGQYLIIGGMPQIVKEYIEKKDFNFVNALQKNINDAYIADMAKYTTPNETARIMAAYNTIPAQLAKENKKFQYRLIKSGARAIEYESALDWLHAAGIAYKCIKTNEGNFPLSLYATPESFKIYLSDVGLLCSKLGISPIFILGNLSGFNNIKGALTENYVMNSLTTNGLNTYYWESKGKAELDFLIQKNDGNIIPIEVKSSDNVRAKSLNQYIAKYNPVYSIRISTKNFGFDNNIKSVPLYAVHCIKNE